MAIDDNSIGTEKTFTGSSGKASAFTLSHGDTLGQYTVIRPLGRGGMGEVYEVEHAVLRKRYALKMLGAELTVRPDAVERFKREAQVMAGLEHPNVLAVDEFGVAPPESPAAGRYWLRMKLAGSEDVRSLEDLARDSGGKLDADIWHMVMSHVLEGLAYAHERGIVHRDLKPSNILLSVNPAGKGCLPVIADFGLARLVGEDWLRSQVEQSVRLSMSIGDARTIGGGASSRATSGEGTSTRALLGTYEYMSPEQKAGAEATEASDIYAIGLMGYRLLTGRSPTMKKPSELVPGLALGWDCWIGDCLEEEPKDRPTARKLLDRMPAKMMAPPKPPPARPQPAATGSPRTTSAPRLPSPPPPTPPPPRWGLRMLLLGAVVGGVWLALAHPDWIEQGRKFLNPQESGTDREVSAVAAVDTAERQRLAEAQRQREESARRNQPRESQNWTSPATGMKFVWIEALKIWVGKYEVTNGEYRKKEPRHDSKSIDSHSLNGDRQPVVYVNFDDAKAYAAWLTERDKAQLGGMRYRVPSEQEFQAYAQCGDGREYPWGNNWPPRSGQAGNYADDAAKRVFSGWTVISGYNDGHAVTAPVEQSWANPWGLYGVGGNVWEVCAKDASGGSFGAWRGASWSTYRQDPLRCAYRLVSNGSYRDGSYGFRLVLSR